MDRMVDHHLLLEELMEDKEEEEEWVEDQEEDQGVHPIKQLMYKEELYLSLVSCEGEISNHFKNKKGYWDTKNGLINTSVVWVPGGAMYMPQTAYQQVQMQQQPYVRYLLIDLSK